MSTPSSSTAENQSLGSSIRWHLNGISMRVNFLFPLREQQISHHIEKNCMFHPHLLSIFCLKTGQREDFGTQKSPDTKFIKLKGRLLSISETTLTADRDKEGKKESTRSMSYSDLFHLAD